MLLAFIAIFPMLSAFVSYAIGRKNKNARNRFACAVTAVEFLAVLAASFGPAELDIKGVFALGCIMA